MPVSLVTSCLPEHPFFKFILHVTNDAQKSACTLTVCVMSYSAVYFKLALNQVRNCC